MARFRSPNGVVVSVADGKAAPVGYSPVEESKPAAAPAKAESTKKSSSK